jgi:sugar phosphate isomerase/epimerase
VCNSGYLDWKHSTYDEVRRSLDLLNEAGRKLRAMGVNLHYHNHDFEFQNRLEGAGNKTIMEVTVAGLDPTCCDLCVDTAWVHRGLGLTKETAGKAAVWLREHASKIGYIHLKDWSATAKSPKGEDGFWTELGRGDVDNRACLEEISRNERVRFVMWEQDASVIGAAESCRVSGEWVQRVGSW